VFIFGATGFSRFGAQRGGRNAHTFYGMITPGIF